MMPPMSQLSRYLIRQITGPMVFIAAALTGIILLSQSLRMVDMIVNKGLSIATFAELTALLLPGALALILPIGLFIAVLVVFNRLSNDSELVVMFAAGVDKQALIRPTMVVAGAVLVIVMILNLYVTPLALRTFKDAVFEIRSNYASVLIQEGEFNTPVDGLTVYVRTRQAGGELEGILVHDNRDHLKPVTMLAERGALVRGSDGPRFLLVNGNRQEVERETGKLSLLYFDRYTIDLANFAAPQETRWIEPSERFLSELFNPALSGNDLRNLDRLRVEGHRRLTTPFYAIAFAAIALAGAVGGEFSRRGQGMRILAAGAVGVVFRLAEIGLASVATAYPALTVLLYLNVIAGIGVALWVLLRQPARSKPLHAEPEAA
jgi:lipopolysaccharide export system permease protein